MKNFDLYQKTYFAFGRNTESRAGELVRRFGGTCALLHYGGGSAERSGLLERVRQSLRLAEVAFCELGGVKPNPRSGLIQEGIELCRREGVDFVLAVGGGSALDSAKAIAAGACYDGDFWDIYEGKAPYLRALPKGCVLTLSASGSEASNSSVITREPEMLKRGVRSDLNRMDFAIMNPELTTTLPPFQTACGVCDIMAHVFERYFTEEPDVDVTDRLCEGVLQSLLRAAPVAMREPTNYAARAEIMWAGKLAHDGTLGVGRVEDWASHAIEHELSAKYDVAHGAGLAVVFPQWIRYTLPRREMRCAQLAVRVFGCEMDFSCPERTALEGIARLEAFWKRLGLPSNFKELGAEERDIPALAAMTKRDARGMTGFYQPLTQADVERILRMCV